MRKDTNKSSVFLIVTTQFPPNVLYLRLVIRISKQVGLLA